MQGYASKGILNRDGLWTLTHEVCNYFVRDAATNGNVEGRAIGSRFREKEGLGVDESEFFDNVNSDGTDRTGLVDREDLSFV